MPLVFTRKRPTISTRPRDSTRPRSTKRLRTARTWLTDTANMQFFMTSKRRNYMRNNATRPRRQLPSRHAKTKEKIVA
jgi:hypothetical protein